MAVKHPVKTARKLLHWDELPSWLQDNQHILTGYRPASSSFLVSFQSLCYVHADRLTAFEFTYPENKRPRPHSLIVIGGLGDGLLTVPFLSSLAEALEDTDWSLFQVLLSSSFTGWSLSRLGRDAEEVGQCVHYVRNYKQTQLGDKAAPKVVIMGHSTGSQDTLHYLYMPNPLPVDPVFDGGLRHLVRPAVDGAILQAPVSDREVIQHVGIGGQLRVRPLARFVSMLVLPPGPSHGSHARPPVTML
ncbi:hypothetical protein VTN31DRAFT_1393 [Thermomyces dupontii]|uniref:uncharacterized protein n=1 Tax=Talaromyces thermophilus TaxID=28565 RepID=UPI00374298AF